ncbi:MAG TPA: hypothetical protein VGO68_18175 [Pyrinomonadaceae bacterium]|nr:hypothetical protein [Pyrinomonadaceae bacterium]
MKSKAITIKALTFWLAAVVFVFAVAVEASAQGGSPGGPPAGAGQPANINPRVGERVRTGREANLRSAEMEAGEEAENQKRILAAIANMKQDFARIQVLRNDIARNLIAHKPLDYSVVTDQSGEINKRAQRLNSYMLAHPPDSKEPETAADFKNEEMVGALVKLCKLIDSFTENPALKSAATIDAEQTEKAREDKAKADADLLAIIKLSETIQKQAGELKVP